MRGGHTKEAIDDVVYGDHLAKVLKPEENAKDGEVRGVQEETSHGPYHDCHCLQGLGHRV